MSTVSVGTLRALGESDADAALALINEVQPHIPWSKETYRWQLLEGAAGPAMVRGVEHEGELVALYVATRKRLRFEGRVVAGCMVQDVMTHPTYRGRGLLNDMAKAFLAETNEGSIYAYTFPNKLSENSFRRSGWTELMGVPARHAAVRRDARGGTLTPVPAFADDVGAIWSASALRIGVERDAAFLRWRYARPGTVYHRFVLGAAGGAGFCVLKIYERDDGRVVHVCDLVVREGDRALLADALASVHAFANEQGARTLTCWLPEGHPYAAAYADAGFTRDTTNDRFVFVHGPATSLATLATASAWHLTQGDSDVY
jgi:GNAT superfamily N-acetyltransferase